MSILDRVPEEIYLSCVFDTYQIHWEIIDKAKSFSPGDEYCQLCIKEKSWIMKYEGDKRLNSNDELISTCRHRRKYLLGRIKNTGEIDIRYKFSKSILDRVPGGGLNCTHLILK